MLPTVALVLVSARTARFFVGKDRKSTRLNSSHSQISYAVFCLKKKKITQRMLQARGYQPGLIDVLGETSERLIQVDFNLPQDVILPHALLLQDFCRAMGDEALL